MTPAKIKLGFAPTRRSIFSAPAAIEYRNLTAQRLEELGVEFVDITDINKEGLLYDDNDLPAIAAKFKAEKVDGLFFRMATLVPSMRLPAWQRRWGCRFCCGVRETSARMRTVYACVTLSADCLRPVRFCAGSGFRSPT